MADLEYLIGYGTLLLRASLGSSIGRASASGKQFMPILVEGFQRSFNIRPDHYKPSFKYPQGGEESAAMNVQAAPGHRFNGIAFQVAVDEFLALDRREACYERVQVPMLSFETGAPFGEGHVYVGKEPWITRDPARLMPLWRDVVWGRTGAYQIGREFGAVFDETTFLGDGTRLVADVYREMLLDVRDVEFPDR